jgi:DNA-binding LytR/AlgR family response regulator
MDKIRTIIADDERPAREFLKAVIRGFEQIELVGEADSGTAAVELIRNAKPDLAFLDLKMPEMGGLDVVRSLPKSETPLIAFVTAYDEFAVKAFELNAVDYLLKPVETARLGETINRASERLEQEDWRTAEVERQRLVRETLEGVRPERLTRIPVRVRDEIRLLLVEDIVSILADGELLHLTTADGKKYTINHRLKDLEPRLCDEHFVRLSRGAIVNLNHVARISPMPGGTYSVTLTDSQEIASSRLQSKILRSKLLKL